MTKRSRRKKKKRKERSSLKALVLASANGGLEGPNQRVRLMWMIYLDWCRWKPVAWYVSFGEYMRLLLTEKDNLGFSDRGRMELKEKANVAREILPRLLEGYGLTVSEEMVLYAEARPLWKVDLASEKADPLEGFDGWLGKVVARKDHEGLLDREKHLYGVVRAHLKGVRDGMLGTSQRHVRYPKMPPWLGLAAGKDIEVPVSDLVSAVERMAQEVRNRPPTEDEKRHARRSIHNWGF